METVLSSLLQAVEQRIHTTNDSPEPRLVGLHRGDARTKRGGVFEPLRAVTGARFHPCVLMECRHLAHLPDTGNIVAGRSTQEIRAVRDLDAGAEVQHVEQEAFG